MSRSNGSLIIYVKMKGKENFHAYTMSLFYILQKHYLHRSCIFFNDHYNASFQGSILEALMSLSSHKFACASFSF